ncbi:hypothetical protein EUX98_g5723 [Antrodiella citrinella]|uniref:Protein kinase domain-containing protein n=1 Tax=Antrodiella citrinella TaxID=2447956 RepID=A0A4S4MRR1_9APHY|nr:hypothetical protein EUX98_g5723 [Antrodiella citrinella]
MSGARKPPASRALSRNERNAIRQHIVRALRDENEQSELLSLPSEKASFALDEVWRVIDFPMYACLKWLLTTCVCFQSLDSSTKEHRLTYDTSHKLLRLSLKLALKNDVLPGALFLVDVRRTETESRGTGGFADVFIGTYHSTPVAIKRIRVYDGTQEDEKIKQRRAFFRESMLWKYLRHRHVLQLLGVSQDIFSSDALCIVLPWREKGSIRLYLRELKKQESVSGGRLAEYIDEWVSCVYILPPSAHLKDSKLFQVAAGVAYLHQQRIVHGDLHGGNILLNDDDTVCLTDFGTALIAEATAYNYGSAHGGGAMYWQAPEVIDPDHFGLPSGRTTYASDMYSFACTCVELYTGEAPFADLTLAQFMNRIRVHDGSIPPRPRFDDGTTCPDTAWHLLTSCWDRDASKRPRASVVTRTLNRATLLASPAIGRYRLAGRDIKDRLYQVFTSQPDVITDERDQPFIPLGAIRDVVSNFVHKLDFADEILSAKEIVAWFSCMPLPEDTAFRVGPLFLLQCIMDIPCTVPGQTPLPFYPTLVTRIPDNTSTHIISSVMWHNAAHAGDLVHEASHDTDRGSLSRDYASVVEELTAAFKTGLRA